MTPHVNRFNHIAAGMDLLDKFAMAALASFGEKPGSPAEARELAEKAYLLGEAMFEARLGAKRVAWFRMARWLDDHAVLLEKRLKTGPVPVIEDLRVIAGEARDRAKEIRALLEVGEFPVPTPRKAKPR